MAGRVSTSISLRTAICLTPCFRVAGGGMAMEAGPVRQPGQHGVAMDHHGGSREEHGQDCVEDCGADPAGLTAQLLED